MSRDNNDSVQRNFTRIANGYVLTEGREVRGGVLGAPTTPKPQIQIVAQKQAAPAQTTPTPVAQTPKST